MKNIDEFVDNLNRKIKEKKKKILFLCIGTNEILWDSIGPTIGTFLQENLGKDFVLGDIKNNIICKNDLIYNHKKIKDRYIVAIDSALSPLGISGEIFISNSPVVMGLGVNNYKGIIGDISIKVAICNEQKMTKEYVNNIAGFVSTGITRAFFQKEDIRGSHF